MKTEKVGVVTILDNEGELVGIIYNDMSTRRKVMFKCEQMSEDEMIAVLEDKVERKLVVSIPDDFTVYGEDGGNRGKGFGGSGGGRGFGGGGGKVK